MATASGPTPSTLNQADIAGAISGYYGVASGDAAVAKLLEVILPDIQSATARDPVSWKSVFPTVLAKYEKMAKDLGLGISPQQREIEAARNANPSAAGLAGFEFGKLAGLREAGMPLAMRDDGAARASGGERATAAALARDAHLTVSGAIGFAKELGISPAYAGFFAGGSQVMRDALRDAITKGASITDDQIKSMKDVGMVLGAVRAGKLSPDDPRIPPSVKQVIEDMKAKGIDPTKADTKTIQKYLKDNPKALEAARNANVTATRKDAGQADAQVKQRNVAAENAVVRAAKTHNKAKPNERSSGLGI